MATTSSTSGPSTSEVGDPSPIRAGRARSRIACRDACTVHRCRRARRLGPHWAGQRARTRRRDNRPHRGGQPGAERGHPGPVRTGSVRSGGRPARRAVPRRPDPVQGPRLRDGRRAAPRGHAVPQGPRLPAVRNGWARAAIHRRRFHLHRSHQHPRDRARPHHRAGLVRTHPQPVARGHHVGWFEWRLGGRSREWDGLGRARERRRWIDSDPGCRVRTRRSEADARSRADQWTPDRDLQLPHRRGCGDPDRSGHRRDPRRHRRAAPRRPHPTGASEPAVARDDATHAGSVADRLPRRHPARSGSVVAGVCGRSRAHRGTRVRISS